MLTTGKGFGELNETLFDQINALARATAWLHGVIIAYVGYGVVVFALLLGAGWWLARRSGEPRRVAAMVCAGAGTLLAVGINQPIVDTVHEARPYTDHPGVLVPALAVRQCHGERCMHLGTPRALTVGEETVVGQDVIAQRRDDLGPQAGAPGCSERPQLHGAFGVGQQDGRRLPGGLVDLDLELDALNRSEKDRAEVDQLIHIQAGR